MATIVQRKKKDGSTVYTAQIRLRVDGRVYSDEPNLAESALVNIFTGIATLTRCCRIAGFAAFGEAS
ncbi:MAG: hypothetical protein B7X37_04115 [Halothiobacillus sp. 14-55-98]|jgi:hypothetical protein|nr:MAG: hypothetical protein B7X37_04115 [Halothiobacillus sp. 14-55-98]